MIDVRQLAYVRFSAPNLDRMQEFLSDFGLRPAHQIADALWMRGSGSSPFVHMTERGEPGYLGFGFEAANDEEFERLARTEGQTLQAIAPEAGGGRFIRLRDPDGFEVDVVAGRTDSAPIAGPDCQPWNTSSSFGRGTVARRVAPAPSAVVRLGHVVHAVSDLQRTWNWYAERFRLIVSDNVQTAAGDSVALFIRLNKGEEPTDHHALNFGEFPSKRSRFHHAAFEVADFDDLMVGNEYLAQRDHRHRWGIGRHVLGSQIFDYWSDPWGHVLEHWTDGDVFDAGEPSHIANIETMVGRQWGPAAPEDMVS